MLESVPKNKQVILFDGVCNLCNTSVLYIIKRDRHNRFLFAPLDSAIGKSIINEFSIDTEKTDSILLYQPKRHQLKYKSSAALHIVKHLRFPAKFYIIFFLVPGFIRNWAYDIIAKNRYRWFGKKDQCMVPTPELQSKFLN